MTYQEANAALAKLGLSCRTSGQGEFVTDQAPSPGSSVPKGSSIVLYLGTERAAETVPMPDLSGMTYQEAKEKLESVGLYLNATGTGETGKVFAQEVEPNTPVEVGTAVEVKFVDEVADDKDAIED
jgi:stage V sporulation protein D (sporulation-specific penicillin-binding protein)